MTRLRVVISWPKTPGLHYSVTLEHDNGHNGAGRMAKGSRYPSGWVQLPDGSRLELRWNLYPADRRSR